MEHYINIRLEQVIHIVGSQFNSPAHNGLNDLKIYVLESMRVQPESTQAVKLRYEIEKNWIYRLRSQVLLGLNLFD